ncbi:amidohydrolase [Sinomonas sp. ASV322]|uniref:amidohydrolase n=1 Tax=Sinomonas sp. ASV322 TaxID=3041920 RepID=UPI0035A2AFF8
MTTSTPAGSPELAQKIEEHLGNWRPRVTDLARTIHANPELSFEEHAAAASITALLEEAGFSVERGTGGLPTAFTGTIGSGELTVAVCIEYDSLPEVGHACGHNLIAGSTVGAALALAPLADELGITLKAIGTPAEEHGGGKVLLLDAGAFDGVGLALMAHPGTEGYTSNPLGTSSQAVGRFRATFAGQAAHAAAMPHLGVNAADAAVLSQVAVGLLRQQTPDNQRIALFVAEAGVATNIIPDRAVVEFECRAFTLGEYEALLGRVKRCFEGAALATGAALTIEPTEPLYEPLIQDEELAAYWNTAMGSRGRDVSAPPAAYRGGGSTDMGNISQVIPSIHPMFGVPGADAPIHSAGFTAAAGTLEAYEVMFDAAFSLAATVAAAVSEPARKARFTAAAYEPARV